MVATELHVPEAAPTPPAYVSHAGHGQPPEDVYRLARKLAHKMVRLYSTLHLEAADLFQEAALAISRAWPRYTPDKGKPTSYAYRFALGAMQDYLRSRHADGHTRATKRQAVRTGTAMLRVSQLSALADTDDGLDCASVPPVEIDDGPEAELVAALRARGATIYAADAELLGLYYARGVSMQEIGRRWGVSDSAVCYQHKRLLERLRSEITPPR